jgi:hypothetical protein
MLRAHAVQIFTTRLFSHRACLLPTILSYYLLYACIYCMYVCTESRCRLPTYLLTQTCSLILVYPLLCIFFFLKKNHHSTMADMPGVRCTLIRASRSPRIHASKNPRIIQDIHVQYVYDSTLILLDPCQAIAIAIAHRGPSFSLTWTVALRMCMIPNEAVFIYTHARTPRTLRGLFICRGNVWPLPLLRLLRLCRAGQTDLQYLDCHATI